MQNKKKINAHIACYVLHPEFLVHFIHTIAGRCDNFPSIVSSVSIGTKQFRWVDLLGSSLSHLELLINFDFIQVCYKIGGGNLERFAYCPRIQFELVNIHWSCTVHIDFDICVILSPLFLFRFQPKNHNICQYEWVNENWCYRDQYAGLRLEWRFHKSETWSFSIGYQHMLVITWAHAVFRPYIKGNSY